MPRICYVPKEFGPAALETIRRANDICRDYAERGYDLTLRQLFYRFVANAWIRNNQNEYKRLGQIINDARLAGLIDWDYITDRTRNLRHLTHWNTPAEMIAAQVDRFHHDKWREQGTRIEVWVEKDALVGIVGQAAVNEDVSFFSCRGYTSQSEVWGAAQRIRGYIEDGQQVIILHLGDHDPSGVDMTRDIRDRMNLFIGTDLRNNGEWVKANNLSEWFRVERIALNMDQIQEFSPPPNYAKATDSRSPGYVAEYGNECWELDALPPDVLDALIRTTIESYRDTRAWNKAVVRERRDRKFLERIATNYRDVVKFLNERRDRNGHKETIGGVPASAGSDHPRHRPE